MQSDYAKISAENTVKYGTEVSYYGNDFADRYTERTHFIFELLQNAEDALRWREETEPGINFPRNVIFRLFPDHLEVTHSGLPFTEEHVRAICSIKRGTKSNSLTDIGKFGLGFKSVYAYSKRPEVHSGEEHFAIESYVHPRPIGARNIDASQTLFYIPFDHDEIPAEKAYAEISAKLAKLGFRTLLFLNQIESVDWSASESARGSYFKQSIYYPGHKEVLLSERNERGNDSPPQRWFIFSRPITSTKGELSGAVEGYDIESRNITGEIERYIEVKAISAAWGERGVTLSQPQFTAARQMKERYWLYVVENPSTPLQIIHRIQNPAIQVKSFTYDHGWQVLSEARISS